MNRIRLLPELVANQIAAGEVVERPASVVKELVENAIDADAKRILVDIQSGGRALIRVTDDGVGMGRDDALLCLERHATSKIRSADDLFRISTMGFRGEALPSIASVCRFSLTTRERGSSAPEGTQVIVQGGVIADVKAAGHADGTTVEVRQLFHNVPARRKFLKSDDTERAHIQHFLQLAALAHPDIGFTFLQDQRQVWQLPPLNIDDSKASKLAALQERLRSLFGHDLPLIEVNFRSAMSPSREWDALREAGDTAESSPTLSVWGFIGAPGVSRATRADQNLFVNRRPIENRGLNFALLEGYHTALMKGRYPVCCLFLEVDPAEVDVNVHPSKKEVKFRHEHEVRRLMASAVRSALLGYHEGIATAAVSGSPTAAPGAKPGRENPPQPASKPEVQLGLDPSRPIESTPTDVRHYAAPGPGFPSAAPEVHPELAPRMPLKPEVGSEHQTPLARSAPPPSGAPVPSPPSAPIPAPRPEANSVVSPGKPLLAVPLRILGVIGQLYVVLESDRGLVLLDQHAAHERVLFEQMLARMESGTAPSQKLLMPETVELKARDAQFLRGVLPALVRLGVGLSEFGDRTFLLDALPPFVTCGEPRRFVIGLIDQLKAEGQDVNPLRLGEPVVAKTVCRHAVKANDFLRGPELERLLADLRRCAMPYTCPHGRPTMIEMSCKELDKKFGRVQA